MSVTFGAPVKGPDGVSVEERGGALDLLTNAIMSRSPSQREFRYYNVLDVILEGTNAPTVFNMLVKMFRDNYLFIEVKREGVIVYAMGVAVPPNTPVKPALRYLLSDCLKNQRDWLDVKLHFRGEHADLDDYLHNAVQSSVAP
jgi:hypothetical protein